VIAEGRKTMRAAGYCRVSSQEQVEGTSLRVQEDQIKAYATMKNIELVSVLVDAGVSGGKPLSERAEGKKLVEMVDSGKVQAVVITKLDRGFRSTVDCLQTVQIWEKRGIALHIVDMGGNAVDATSAAGRFMLTVLVAAAEMERGRIRERCNEGRKRRRAEGRRIGQVPYGYDLAKDGKNLVPNESQQEALKLVSCLRARGESLRAIATELNKQGIPAKKGGPWTYGQVQSALTTNGKNGTS